jgi:two-component system, LytTR family, sensor kinase
VTIRVRRRFFDERKQREDESHARRDEAADARLRRCRRDTETLAPVRYTGHAVVFPRERSERWKAIALVFGAWTFFALFFGGQSLVSQAYAGRPITWSRTLSSWLSCGYLWALLTPFIIRLARQYPLFGANRLRAIAIHLAAGIGFTLLQLVLYIAVQRILFSAPNDPRTFADWFSILLIVDAHSNFLLYWTVIGIAQAVESFRMQRERELLASRLEARTSQLEAQLATAQLDTLKMQLHPHFLFNTLNTIGVLMRQDVEAANRMIVRLSGLLRVALANSGTQEIPLRDELEFLRNYLEIEQTRFHDRLSVVIDADPATLDAKVPNLILQPLVENAVRHGIAPRATAGRIEVRAARHNGKVELSVCDNGRGLSGDDRPGTGIGLANTRARLEKLYGAEARFELVDAPGGGAVATISLPFRTDAS